VRSTRPEDPGTELAKLTDPERRAASERFRVIWPLLYAGVPLKRLAGEHGKSLRTLRYWVALYRKGDLPALAPKPCSQRGKCRIRRRESRGVSSPMLGTKLPRRSACFARDPSRED
jgi:transposase-like protein